MLAVNHLIGFGVSASGIDVQFLGTATDTLSFGQQTYSFASQPFGDEAPDRVIFICASESNLSANTITSATIGGQAANISVNNAETGQGHNAAIISVLLPGGVSGTVTITLSGTVDTGSCHIGIYRAVGVQSLTASDTGLNDNDPVSMTVDVPQGGFILACGAFDAEFEDSFTTVGVVEDFEDGTAEPAVVFAHLANATAELNRTVSFTRGNGEDAAGVCASFR